MKESIHKKTTDLIIKQLSENKRPWTQPWENKTHLGGSNVNPLRFEGTPYQGINIIILWMSSIEHGYSSPYWMTWNQAKKLNAYVRKYEKDDHGTSIMYVSTGIKEEKIPETGVVVEHPWWKARSYVVHNADCIEGLPKHYYAPPVSNIDEKTRIENVESFIKNTKATIIEGNNKAFYSLNNDSITMPSYSSFHSPEDYYSTVLHELTHWTAHGSRLSRDLENYHKDRKSRANEELIAELGSAYLCASLTIELTPREDHSSYIKSWLEAVKEDEHAIFKAAGEAQKAVNYLDNLQPNKKEKAA